ncbi:MAG: hypothetical protein GJ680_16740 [Alteromonadaceae bacterium]|nr:hypothetical protein [Alteromonadaceae bacterium]
MSNTDWRKIVQRLIKAEMSLKGVKYQDLSDKLLAIGVKQSADNLRNKVNKGILGADLLLQLVYVLDTKRCDKTSISEILQNIANEQE